MVKRKGRRAMQTPTERGRQMQYDLTMSFGVGSVDPESGSGDGASRYSLPSERGGRLIRDAGLLPQSMLGIRTGTRIKVAWAREVSWKSTVRLTKPR
jgi:hypothetical protein